MWSRLPAIPVHRMVLEKMPKDKELIKYFDEYLDTLTEIYLKKIKKDEKEKWKIKKN